jgi:hypothetical protein
MLNRAFGLALLAGVAAVHWGDVKNRKTVSWLLAGGLLVLHRRPIKMLYGDMAGTVDKLLAGNENKGDELR